MTNLLLDHGHEVVGIDSLNDAHDSRLKHVRLEQLQGREDFTFLKDDIAGREFLDQTFADHGPFEAVVNLAARAGVRQSVENPWVYVETNTTATLNLLEACRNSGTKKFVVASTSSVYGKDNEVPNSEDADTSKPLSPYAASKMLLRHSATRTITCTALTLQCFAISQSSGHRADRI